MAENKTKATGSDVESYLASVENAAGRTDGRALAGPMVRWAGERPQRRGPTIVGIGSSPYSDESGRMKRLSEVDVGVPGKRVTGSLAELRRRHGPAVHAA